MPPRQLAKSTRKHFMTQAYSHQTPLYGVKGAVTWYD